MAQDYLLESHATSVILGNSALLKCEVPSFVADFVTITGWLEEESGDDFYLGRDFGICYSFVYLWVYVINLFRYMLFICLSFDYFYLGRNFGICYLVAIFLH